MYLHVLVYNLRVTYIFPTGKNIDKMLDMWKYLSHIMVMNLNVFNKFQVSSFEFQWLYAQNKIDKNC